METLKVTVSAMGIAHVEMARPAVLNAFNELMIEELDETFTALTQEPSVRIVVLSGEGKAFSAGADLQWMKRASLAGREENLRDARRFAAMMFRVASCPKPTIARVQGLALGGGLGLACACDFALASEDAKFAASEAKFGILPSVIGPYLVNAVGKRQALRLALAASRIDAPQAMALGLIQQVVPLQELDECLEALIGELTQNGLGAMTEIKRLYAQLEVGPITDDVRELTAQTIAEVRTTPEAREGFDAFLEKRPAAWVPARR